MGDDSDDSEGGWDWVVDGCVRIHCPDESDRSTDWEGHDCASADHAKNSLVGHDCSKVVGPGSVGNGRVRVDSAGVGCS